jgi:hypothetical protein
MKALVVVGLLLSSSAALAQGQQQQPGEQNPSCVGRWYSSNVRECEGKQGSTAGLLVYTPKQLHGMENTCRIASTQSKGNAIEMLLRCSGEGMTSTERESVYVSGNKLQRRVTVNRKLMSFTYTRCP